MFHIEKIKSFFIRLHDRYPAGLYILLFWLIAYCAGYSAQVLFPIQHEYGGFPWLVENNSVWNFFVNTSQTWDSIHYSRIATYWYAPIDHIGNKDYLYAFFPLYPLLIALVSIFTQNVTFSMVVLSIALPLLASSLVYRFYQRYFPNHNPLYLTLISFLVPFSFFFFVNYTESLYVVMEIATLFFVLNKVQKKYYAMLGLLLGVGIVWNRSVGLLFVGSLFAVYTVHALWYTYKKKKLNTSQIDRWLKSMYLLAGSVMGIIVFFVHNLIRTGDFLISRHVQDYFGRGSTLNPLVPFARGIEDIMNGERFSRGVFFIPIILIILFFVCRYIYLHYHRFALVGVAAFLYTVLTIYLNLTADSLASTNRYVLTSPLYFIFLPIVVMDYINKSNKKWLFTLLLGFLFIFFLFSFVLFTRHFWVG